MATGPIIHTKEIKEDEIAEIKDRVRHLLRDERAKKSRKMK
jgi:hypothetical protein